MRETRKCEDCGQETKSWDIHHKDRNHNNNDPSNRKTLCKQCHGRIHGYDAQNEDYGVRFGDSYDRITNRSLYAQRLQDGFELLNDD